MKRVPVLATALVGLAVLLMIALGVWQLRRAEEKSALLAALSSNAAKPPVAMPRLGPVPPELLFRRSSAMCLEVVAWRSESGRAADGTTGYRRIADCRTGSEGPGLLVDMGVTRDFKQVPAFTGGLVSGVITSEPDHRSVLAGLFDRAVPLRPMLVSEVAAPGLKPTRPPTIGDVPNNHRGYAGQWFLFAASAAAIYFLALRRRSRRGSIAPDA